LFLASGRGSNFQSFVDHVRLGVLKDVQIRALVCNRTGAPVVSMARAASVEAIEIDGISSRKFQTSEERENARLIFDNQCLALVHAYSADFVLLAGFDQILTKAFVDNLPDRILNIHPAYDLKQFGGKNMVGSRIHGKVIESKQEFSGCTVHIVQSAVDQGPAILKKKVPVFPGDTPELLERRIIQQEHLVYPKALQLLVDGRVMISSDGSRCFIDPYSDNWDVEWHRRQKAYIDEAQDFQSKREIDV
jgi:phosphoribosylglycinamide formyltransferase 1